jgi:anti-sigma B factor antagonist
LNGAVSDRLRAKLVTFFKDGGRVVFDLGALHHFDGRGLGAMLYWLRTADEASTHVVICGLSKPVRTLFELLGLYKAVEICASREDALAASARALQAQDEPLEAALAHSHAGGK